MGRRLKLPMSQPASVMNAKPQALKDAKATSRWIVITPELATRWLEECNWNNRPVRDGWVTRLASDMRAGNWRGQNGEAIKFDNAGRLVDGQHRLWAVVMSKVSIESLLVEGVDPEDYSTIDIGAKKALQDFLGPMGGEKNVHMLSSALRLVYAWQHDKLSNLKDGKKMPTVAELEETLVNHPKIRTSVAYVSGKKSVRDVLTPSFACLIHYAGLLGEKVSTVESFLDRLGDGVGLDADDPVYQLRTFLQKQRGPSPGKRRVGKEYVLAVTIKAWNLSKAESKIKVLKFQLDEEFPVL